MDQEKSVLQLALLSNKRILHSLKATLQKAKENEHTAYQGLLEMRIDHAEKQIEYIQTQLNKYNAEHGIM